MFITTPVDRKGTGKENYENALFAWHLILYICIFEVTTPVHPYGPLPIDAREQECGNAGTQ